MKNQIFVLAVVTGVNLIGYGLSAETSWAADITTVTWNLDNVTFNDGGKAFGSFTYNPETNIVSDVEITTTVGELLSGTTYGRGTSENGLAFSFTPRLLSDVIYSLNLTFAEKLTSDKSGYDIESGTELFRVIPTNIGAQRQIIQGNITAVPEPLTFFGVGVALAFGTAFKRQLKQKQLHNLEH